MASLRTTHVARVTARAVGFLVNLFMIAVTLAAAVYLVPGFVGLERYVITGGSMSGTIEKGSIVIERAVPVEELRVGDVITYLPPPESGVGNVLTHRIAEIDASDGSGPVLRTKGDANADVDPWTFRLSGDAQPRLVLTIPLLGYAFLALAEPAVRLAVITVPASAVGLHSLLQLIAVLRMRIDARSASEENAPGRVLAGA